MDADPPLDYLLEPPTGGSGPPPGREELLAIVARSRSQRHRLVSAGLVAALVAGAAGGWLAASRPGSFGGSGGARVAAGAPTTTVRAPVAALAGPPAGGGWYGYAPFAGGNTLSKLFVRTTADSVALRVYHAAAPNVPPIPGCPVPVPMLQVEVSTPEVAGQAFGPYLPSAPAPFKSWSGSVIGVAEGAPVVVLTAETESVVAQVRAVFADGKVDQMAPVNGWVALAHLAAPGSVTASDPIPTASLEALDPTGKVIGKLSLPPPSATVPPGKVPPPIGPPMPAGGPVPNSSGAVSVGPATPATPATPAHPALPVPTTVPGSPPNGAIVGTTVPPCLGIASSNGTASGSSGAAANGSPGSK